MPPGPAYNWYCVAHGVFDILSRAAQIRAVQAETQASRVLRRESRHNTRGKPAEKDREAPVIITPALHVRPLPEATPFNAPRAEEPAVQAQLEQTSIEKVFAASEVAGLSVPSTSASVEIPAIGALLPEANVIPDTHKTTVDSVTQPAAESFIDALPESNVVPDVSPAAESLVDTAVIDPSPVRN